MNILCLQCYRRYFQTFLTQLLKCSYGDFSSGSTILLAINLEFKTILQNISSRIVGSVLANIPSSNNFRNILLLQRFHQNCQAPYVCFDH